MVPLGQRDFKIEARVELVYNQQHGTNNLVHCKRDSL